MFGVCVYRSCDEGCIGSESESEGVEGLMSGPFGCGACDESGRRGGRELSFCESVDAVIEEQDFDIDISPHGVNELRSPDTESVAVACDDPDLQIGSYPFESSSDGGRASMDAVHTVSFEVVGKAARAPDS